MAQNRKQGISHALRQRIVRGLESGALRDGDALPSTRELAIDLGADPRVIAEAYRALAGEGLVEIRPRSGVYVAALPGGATALRDPSAAWLASVIADAVRRGVAAPALAGVLERATRARPMSAATIAGTLDQAMGVARELRDELGIDARGFLDEELAPGAPLPRGLARAHLLVGTEATAARVRRLAERLGKPPVVIDVRPDLLSPEWRLLLRRVAYVVVADPRFGALVHEFVQGAEGAHNVRVLLAGRDDLSGVPPEAPSYVTEAARQRLGRSRLPGRVVPPARTLADASLREIAELMVAHNLAPTRPRTGTRAEAGRRAG